MRHKQIYFLTLLLIGQLSCVPNSSVEEERPNILFIMSDDHTSQAWGIYGGILEPYVKNQNIRRLAREGAILQNVFCTNSICVPSRASIMTGKYSHQNGVYTLSEGLHPDSSNVAKELQKAGYETAIIGKWHLKEKPAGFDHYQVLPGQGRYNDPVLLTAQNWEDGDVITGFSADVIGDLSVDWLSSRSDDNPFFLMCHFKATHEPFDYPERYDSMYKGVVFPEPNSLFEYQVAEPNSRTFSGQELEILGQRWVNDKNSVYPGTPFSLENLDSTAARSKIYQKFVGDFLRCGAAIDENIGKLLDYLDKENLTENTIVIYTADQGYFLGEHGFFDKRMFYEEAIRMPFVIRFPREIKDGSTNEDIILNLDFPSLFLDYAGMSTPEYMQGRSFRSNLKGETPPEWRSDFYYRYWLHQTNRPAHIGIRTKRFKLIYFYGLPLGKNGAHNQSTSPAWEFYDLEKDPGENQNAYHDPNYQVRIDELRMRLITLKKSVQDHDILHPEIDSLMQLDDQSRR